MLRSPRYNIRNWPTSPLRDERGIGPQCYIPALHEFEAVGIVALVDNIPRYHIVEIHVVGPNFPRKG